MAKTPFNPSDDRFTRGILRRKVKQLIGQAGFTQQDHEDLEQDLLVRLLQGLPKFDPEIAHRNRFITTVVERHVANILRNKQAKKRCHRRIRSLNVAVTISNDKVTERAQTIGDHEHDAQLGRPRRSAEELTDLSIDLADMIATLPKSWQALLELRKTRTMQEVAHEMGVPRTTLNARMQRIRQRFENSGLRDYLE